MLFAIPGPRWNKIRPVSGCKYCEPWPWHGPSTQKTRMINPEPMDHIMRPSRRASQGNTSPPDGALRPEPIRPRLRIRGGVPAFRRADSGVDHLGKSRRQPLTFVNVDRQREDPGQFVNEIVDLRCQTSSSLVRLRSCHRGRHRRSIRRCRNTGPSAHRSAKRRVRQLDGAVLPTECAHPRSLT